MTREQIEEIREAVNLNERAGVAPAGPTDFVRVRELCDLAERALLLEDVLAAAKRYCKSETGSDGALLYKFLRAAIDRAEGKP